jgi:hypothetical protein
LIANLEAGTLQANFVDVIDIKTNEITTKNLEVTTLLTPNSLYVNSFSIPQSNSDLSTKYVLMWDSLTKEIYASSII